jgi:hypothetical protein
LFHNRTLDEQYQESRYFDNTGPAVLPDVLAYIMLYAVSSIDALNISRSSQ